MRASALEFRLRYWIHVAVIVLGFVAPWNYLAHVDRSRSLWLPAAVMLERTGWWSLTGASNALLGAGILFALVGAWLRTWGTAYLGATVVKDAALQGGAVVAEGPYRYVRNPLYLGTWLHMFALALLMPVSGAVFAVVVIGVEELRLMGAEEAFLARTLGPAYLEYKARVPRIWPALSARVAGSGARPAWGMAVLSEIYMWGVAVSFAALGWRYNAALVTQGVLVSLGVALVARAFVPKAEVREVVA